jgi:hypothetical protein
MRYVVLLATLVSFSATAESPGLLFRLRCDGPNIIVAVKAIEPGVYELPPIPHDVCGKDL